MRWHCKASQKIWGNLYRDSDTSTRLPRAAHRALNIFLTFFFYFFAARYFFPWPTVVFMATPALQSGHLSSSNASALIIPNEKNGAPIDCEVTFSGSRLTTTQTATTLPPTSLTLLTTFLAEPPVLVMSSTTKTLLPLTSLS